MMKSFMPPFGMAAVLILAAVFVYMPSTEAAAPDNRPAEYSFGFDKQDWEGKRPFGFLAFLIRQHDRGANVVTVGDAPEDWITAKDVELLILLMDSEEPCAAVGPGRSSRVKINGDDAEVKASTIGQEAAYLLASYRHGLYPMSGTKPSSALAFDRKAIKQWWEEQQAR